MENPNKDRNQNAEGPAPEPVQAPETTEEIRTEDEENGQTAAQPEDRSQSRRSIVHLLAGAYLIYLGYSLCKNVIQGAEGASPVFFAAGAAFVILGAIFCVTGGKNLLKAEKEKKAAAEGENRSPKPVPAAEKENQAPTPAPEKKSMSIAERARLVSPPEEDGEE